MLMLIKQDKASEKLETNRPIGWFFTCFPISRNIKNKLH